MTMSPRLEATTLYRRWREDLIEEAREDQENGRPLRAGRKRHFARIVFRAIVAEEVDPVPGGLGMFSEPEP